MQQQILTGLTATLMVTTGFLSAGQAGQNPSAPKVGTQINPNGSSLPSTAFSVASGTTSVKVGERQSHNLQTLSPVAQIHAHQLAGRQATTLYVRNLPVVTFLERQSPVTPGIKVAAVPSSTLGNAQAQATAAKQSQDPTWQATAIAAKLNQMDRDSFDARLIRVSWNPQQKTYNIHADQQLLLAVNEQTILPNSTRSQDRDALEITNRLRRQLGNAPALTSIAGRPKPTSLYAQAMTLASRAQLTGMASWYGPGFHGARTANGERFNQYDMTAAHRSLPFGTQVRVTNLNNGRSVVVRINDRGPFIGGRVLDLSKGAASVLGVISSGVAPVRIDILR